MLQLLARSATGERMNPYTSLWTGVTPGDGPQRFHVVLLDNGRSSILAQPTRAPNAQVHPLRRLHECLPRLSPDRRPRLRLGLSRTHRRHSHPAIDARLQHAQSLPYASSLCGACYEVCPVKINIPEVLLDLRAQVTDQERKQASAASLTPCISACASPISSSPRPGSSTPRSFLAASACASSPARTDGFIRCPASAPNGPKPAIFAGFQMQTFHDWWAAREKGGQMSCSSQIAGKNTRPCTNAQRKLGP